MRLRDKKFVNYVSDVRIRKQSVAPVAPVAPPTPKPPLLTRTTSDTPQNPAKKIPEVKRRATMDEETKHTISTRSKSKKSEIPFCASTTRSKIRAREAPVSSKSNSRSVKRGLESSKLQKELRSTRSRFQVPPIPRRRPTPALTRISSKETKESSSIPPETEEIESEKEDSSDEEEESDSEESSDDDSHVKNKRRKRESFESLDYPELAIGDESFYSERSIQPNCSRTPPEYYEMASLWSKLTAKISEETLCDYKFALRDILTGRVSCLFPIQTLVPALPDDVIPVHERLYNLICQSSGAYPFKNHEGTKLVSKHQLTDGNQIGAQIMLECLHYGVIPFDVTNEMTILNQIRNYVRIGIKDLLQETVERLPEGRNTITKDDIKGNLVLNLLS